MDVVITPSKLCGKIKAISSKSHVHRVLISSFLSGELMGIDNLDVSDDIEATFKCLKSLSIENPILNCKESGSTLRFLLPLVSALGKTATFLGEGRLPFRPLSPFIEELAKNGVNFSKKILPFTVSGQLKSGNFFLPCDVSSQFVSALLFALPILDGDSKIIINGKIQSKGYISLTIQTLKDFSIHIEETEYGCFIKGNQTYKTPDKICIEGDFSNSAVFFAMNKMGAEIKIDGLNFNSVQSDRAIMELIENSFNEKKNKIDVSAFPDLFPILAVLASSINGETSLYNAKRLRLKESDRIKSTKCLIESLGGTAIEHEDSLTIIGKGYLDGGAADSFNDHRIVMAAAAASLISRGNIIIKDAQSVNKSYPNFFKDFQSLGGKTNVITSL